MCRYDKGCLVNTGLQRETQNTVTRVEGSGGCCVQPDPRDLGQLFLLTQSSSYGLGQVASAS